MSNTKYVIRHNEFAYNDEWYMTDQVNLGTIKAIYTDKAEAEQAYKSLVVDALYNDQDLCQFDICNGYATDGLYEKIEAFILEKTGEAFNGESVPEMNADDAFEFAQLSGVLHYQLIEVDDSKPNYAIWINHEESYLDNCDTGSMRFGDNEDFMKWDDDDWYFLEKMNHTLHGSLTDLSDSPEILEAFLKNADGISYTAEKMELNINSNRAGYNSIKALNALLKKPLFEIRQMTLEQIQAL